MATSGHAAADGDADDADGADDSGEEQRPKKAAKKDTAQELNGARIFTIAQDAASPVALRYPSSANVAKLTAKASRTTTSTRTSSSTRRGARGARALR